LKEKFVNRYFPLKIHKYPEKVDEQKYNKESGLLKKIYWVISQYFQYVIMVLYLFVLSLLE